MKRDILMMVEDAGLSTAPERCAIAEERSPLRDLQGATAAPLVAVTKAKKRRGSEDLRGLVPSGNIIYSSLGKGAIPQEAAKPQPGTA